MRKSAILITGANGEIGKGLIVSFYKNRSTNIITLDLNKLDSSISSMASEEITGNILNTDLLDQLNVEYEFKTI